MKKIFSFLIGVAVLAMPMQAAFARTSEQKFSDVSYGDSYDDSINWLAENGVVNGYEDGTFGADKCVNRAEFLKMLYAMFEVEVSGDVSNVFSDVEAGTWYGPYVATAYNRGSVQGYEDETFRPGQCVNRVEAVKIAMKEFGGKLSDNTQYYGLSYADLAEDQWYTDNINEALNANLLGTDHVDYGDDFEAYFEPAEGMTRAEVTELLYRLKAVDDSTRAQKYVYSLNPTYLDEDLYFFNQCEVLEENVESDLDPTAALPEGVNFVTNFDYSNPVQKENMLNFFETLVGNELTQARNQFDASVNDDYSFETAAETFLGADWEILLGVKLPEGVSSLSELEALGIDDVDVLFVAKIEENAAFEQFMGRVLQDETYVSCEDAEDGVYWTDESDDFYWARYKDIFVVTPSEAQRDAALDRLKSGDNSFREDLPGMINVSVNYEGIEDLMKSVFTESGLVSMDYYFDEVSHERMSLVFEKNGVSLDGGVLLKVADGLFSEFFGGKAILDKKIPIERSLAYFEIPSIRPFASLIYGTYANMEAVPEEYVNDDGLNALMDAPFAVQVLDVVPKMVMGGEETAVAAYFNVGTANEVAVNAFVDTIFTDIGLSDDDDLAGIYYGFVAPGVYALSNVKDLDDIYSARRTPFADTSYGRAIDGLGDTYGGTVAFFDFQKLASFLGEVDQSMSMQQEIESFSVLDFFVSSMSIDGKNVLGRGTLQLIEQ